MHLHARTIRYFDMIRRSGSVREAARQLHVASSAVNRQLMLLEESLDTPLFERMSTGMRLTPAGEVFSRHVITVLHDEQRLASELEMLRGVRHGAISVAAVEVLTADLMSAVLTSMHRRYPTIQIQVRSCGSEEDSQAVIQGDVDVGIGFSIRRQDGLRQCAVGRFTIGAIVPSEHPIARLARVGFTTCAAYPLIMPAPTLSTHELLQPVIKNYKRSLHVLLETSSVELAKSLVQCGVGLSFKSRLGLERELREGLLVHVPLDTPMPLYYELGVYVRAGPNPSSAVDAFNRLMTEAIALREEEERLALHVADPAVGGAATHHADA